MFQITEKFDSTETVLGISTDGCNGMTGVDNGMIRQFELLKGKAVQWLMCILHLFELVFRHVFTTIGEFEWFLVQRENLVKMKQDNIKGKIDKILLLLPL